MNQIFSKTAFLQSQSGQGCRHLLKGELDILDGMPVRYTSGNPCGTILYEANGEELELYPVMPEWTTEETQTSLFK